MTRNRALLALSARSRRPEVHLALYRRGPSAILRMIPRTYFGPGPRPWPIVGCRSILGFTSRLPVAPFLRREPPEVQQWLSRIPTSRNVQGQSNGVCVPLVEWIVASSPALGTMPHFGGERKYRVNL